jgi:hypothetical protein
VAAVSLVATIGAPNHKLMFGLTDGMRTHTPATTLAVGAWNDGLGPSRVLRSSWSGRPLHRGVPVRLTGRQTTPGFELMVPPTGGRLVIDGAPLSGPVVPLPVAFFDLATGRALGSTATLPGQSISIPTAGCVGVAGAPALRIGVQLLPAQEWAITQVDVLSDLVWVEGESLQNRLNDSGNDAFIQIGPLHSAPHGGATLGASVAAWSSPVRAARTVASVPGVYDVWIRLAGVEAAASSRPADLVVYVDGARIGRTGGEGLVGEGTRLTWLHLGQANVGRTADVEVRFRSVGATAWGEVDALALVPATLWGPVAYRSK